MQDFEKEVKGDPYRRNRMFSQSGKLSGDLQKAGYGLPEKFHFCPPFEIRDYALKSAGGLSEAKTSYPLLISVLSIVPDFVVFAATELGAEATRTHALKGFRKGASLFSTFSKPHSEVASTTHTSALKRFRRDAQRFSTFIQPELYRICSNP